MMGGDAMVTQVLGGVLMIATGGVGTQVTVALIAHMRERRREAQGRESEAQRLRLMVEEARMSLAALAVLAIEHGASKAEADRVLPSWWRRGTDPRQGLARPSRDPDED